MTHMKNIMKFLCIGLLTLIFISGCQARNEESLVSGTLKNITETHLEPSEILQTDEKLDMPVTLSSGVMVDTEVNNPKLYDTSKLSVYQGNVLSIDAKKAADLLMPDTEVTIQEDAMSLEDGSEGIYRIYTGADGSEMFSSNDTDIRFTTRQFEEIRTDFEKDMNNGNVDFAFASVDEANQDIKKFFDELGISVYVEYNCVSMEYKALKEKNLAQYEGFEGDEMFQNEIQQIENQPWSEAYNCYCFTYYGMINDCKLSSTTRDVNNTVIPGSVIRVAYTKNGIQQLEISNLYIEQEEIQAGDPIGRDRLLEIVNQKYNSIILEGSYTLNSVELEYIADIQSGTGKYQLLPAWRCNVFHEYYTNGKTSGDIVHMQENSYFFIDAITGIELYSGVTL